MISRILRGVKRRIFSDKKVSEVSALPSLLLAAEGWKSRANDRLIDLALAAIPVARRVNHQDIADRMIEFPHWPIIWPGEHYNLLSALVDVMKPSIVIEIGTATGYSALAMKKFLMPQGKIYSFDIVPWQRFPRCVLTEADFEDGRLVQVIDDLTDVQVFKKHAPLLRQASLIFVDAAKDGVQEKKFLMNFATLDFVNHPVFVFDDIRVMNMIHIWNDIERPKLDLTSFGHWAGTGLVDW